MAWISKLLPRNRRRYVANTSDGAAEGSYEVKQRRNPTSGMRRDVDFHTIPMSLG
jgi:hypothetical protein